MRRILCPAANRLWNLVLQRETRAYWQSMAAPAATQESLLLGMLTHNRETAFGRLHGFAHIRSVQEYQEKVPLREYADFEPFISRIRAGEAAVLTAEPVLLLEPTGGSCGGSKLIPYTAGLKRQFQRGIAPWIVDLFRTSPELLNGESYWSVSPAMRQHPADGDCIPIGFESDSDYVGGLGSLLVRSVQAVPDQVKYIGQIDSFWYVTLIFLLRSRTLSLISVWNPSFLLILCRHLRNWWPQLAADIAHGTVSPPAPLEDRIAVSLERHNRPDPARAGEIRSACTLNTDFAARHQKLWPRLRLISCWRDGPAQESAGKLQEHFPHVLMQGKGLIATEGFVTIPVIGVDGCLPALRSHFMEFLPQDGSDPLLLHQLEEGSTYSVIVTTAGGLYRYRLNDLVKVGGFHHGVPLLRFKGKEDHIADHFGEKLHEAHVSDALRLAATSSGLKPAFTLLSYEPDPEPGYVFVVEDDGSGDDRLLQTADKIDELLMDNFHYRYCRTLGQLGAVRVFRVAGNGQESYLQACYRQGQRLGDIKPPSLQRSPGWTAAFQGRMLHKKRRYHD